MIPSKACKRAYKHQSKENLWKSMSNCEQVWATVSCLLTDFVSLHCDSEILSGSNQQAIVRRPHSKLSPGGPIPHNHGKDRFDVMWFDSQPASIKLRYKKEALEFLEENLRFDMDRFYQLNPKIFEDYANIGKKATSIRTILKLIQHIKQVKADVMPFIKNPKDMTIWSNEYFLQLAKMINIE